MIIIEIFYHTHTHTVARWTDVAQQQMCNVRPSISEVSSSWQDKWLSEWQIDAASAFISAHFHPFIFLYFLTSTLNASFFVFSLPSWFLSSFPSSPLILFLVVLSHLFHSSFTLFSLCFTPPPPPFFPLCKRFIITSSDRHSLSDASRLPHLAPTLVSQRGLSEIL